MSQDKLFAEFCEDPTNGQIYILVPTGCTKVTPGALNLWTNEYGGGPDEFAWPLLNWRGRYAMMVPGGCVVMFGKAGAFVPSARLEVYYCDGARWTELRHG